MSPFNAYDKCIEAEIDSNCSLPFQRNPGNQPICSSFASGLAAIKKFNSLDSTCKYPCTQVKIDHVVNPSKIVYSKMNPNVEVTKEPGFFLTLPPTVKVLQMSEDYGAVSFIAEFGGWSGLFVGVSILAIVTQFADMASSKCAYLSKGMKNATIIISSIILCYVCYASLDKFFSFNTSNDITIAKLDSNFRLSICREKNLFFNNSYLGGDRVFWVDGNNISSGFYRFNVFTKENGTKGEIKYWPDDTDSKIAFIKDFNVKLVNMILNDTVQFCQSLRIRNLDGIKVSISKEMFLFIHLDEQFFYADGKTRVTAMPEESIDSTDGRAMFAETSTNLNLISNININNGILLYDECIMAQLNGSEKDLYHPSELSQIQSGIQYEDVKKIMRKVEQIQNSCRKPYKKMAVTASTDLNTKINLGLNKNSTPIDKFKHNTYVYVYFPDKVIRYEVLILNYCS